MRVSFLLFLLLPLFCFSQNVRVNVYDKFLKKHRIELEPTVVESSAASKLSVAFTSIASTLYVEVSGWGWGASTIDEGNELVFILANDSMVTVKSTALQSFEPGVGKNTYRHQYYMSERDLQTLMSADLTGVKKYSFKELSNMSIPKANAAKVRQLCAVFWAELRKAKVLKPSR